MATLKITEKNNTSGQPIRLGSSFSIDMEKLVGSSTKSLYIREGLNGALFLSQRGNGDNGSGDICQISSDTEIIVNGLLAYRLSIFAKKTDAILG